MVYKYSPLQPGQIRLLNLEISNSAEIHIELLNVGLDSAPPYEALSYRWLDNRITKHVVVSNQSCLPITRSLFDALRDIRLATTGSVTRTLWADAICINQNDDPEKNDQINRMDQIYYKAQRVVTYIGEGDGNTEPAVALGRKMLDLAESSEPPSHGDREQLFKEQCDYLGIPDSSTINDDDHSDPGIRGLQWMLDASWSRRLWIIQESLLNRNMLMMCGRFEMPWTMLSRLAAFISQRRLPKLFRFSQFRNPDPDGGCASSVLRMGRLRQNFDRLTPIEIIQGANIMLCSDPRDKVYGLLGVFRYKTRSQHAEVRDQKYEIAVNYQKPVADVYVEAARFFLSETSDLRLLASICNEPTVAELPSWVPDWTDETEICLLSSQQGYMAAGGTSRILKIDDKTNRITLAGASIDRLAYVSDELITSVFDARAPHRCCLWLAEQIDRIRRSNKYLNAVDAVWKTFIADTTKNKTSAEDSARALGYIVFSLNIVCRQCSAKECIKIPGIEARTGSADCVGQLAHRSVARSFCITENGYCGLVPKRSQIGDLVAVVRGGRVPLVFRERGNEVFLIGEGYVHGLMHGEAIDGDTFRSPYKEREFMII
ncbi:hypothetical protein FOBRF1_006632 [Fusarium oxysporum]